MNTKKKLIILSIAFILCVTVGGTLAFSTSVEDIANLFSTSKVQIEQHEYERAKDSSGRYTGELVEFTQRQDIEPAYLVNNVIELSNSSQSWESIGLDSGNKLYSDSVKNAIDKFVFVENKGTTDAYVRTIIAFECPEGFDFSLIHTNLNESSKIIWNKNIGYVKLGEQRYYFIVATYKEALADGEMSVPSLLQVLLDSKVTNEDMELFGDTFDILVKTQATQKVDDQTSEQVLNKVFGEPNKDNLNKWFDLRPKFDVTNYIELTDAIDAITEDSIINIKYEDQNANSGKGISTKYKNIEFQGNGNKIKVGGSIGDNNYNYALYITGGNITYNDLLLESSVGGFAISAGAKVTFNSGEVKINSSHTSNRYVFWVYGTNSELTINDGTFAFETYKKRAYIWCDGTTVTINGGTFGARPNHSKDQNRPFIITNNGQIIIKGGTFGFDLSKPYELGYSEGEKIYTIAEGYKVVNNNNGTWTVVPE